MLNYNEIKPKMIIVLKGEPYQVLSAKVFRKQKQKPVNQTKLKHLVSGKVTDYTFQQSDTAEEADIETRNIKYLYTRCLPTGRQEWWFSDSKNPSDRFVISENIISESAKFLKEGVVVRATVFNNNIVGITLPIKIELEVAEAPPSIKGNTASGGTKQVTLETGVVISTPMFIEFGDTIEVNTETGEYVRRISS